MTGVFANLRYAARHPWVRVAFGFAFVGWLALVAALVVDRMVESDHKRLRGELVQRSRALREIGQAEELKLTYERTAREVREIDGKLDYAATQGQLVQDFAELAARHQVVILNQAYEEGRRGGALQVLNTELSVRGSYRSIRGLLLDIPQLRAWTEVREVLLERGRDGTSLDGKLLLTTFRRAEGGT